MTEQDAIETAKSHAAKAGQKVEKLKVKVSKDPTHGGAPHRIDPKTGSFVAVPGRRHKAT